MKKMGDLVKFNIGLKDEYGIFFYITEKEYILSVSGVIYKPPIEKYSPQFICHTALSTHPELFLSEEVILSNFKDGRFEVVFKSVREL